MTNLLKHYHRAYLDRGSEENPNNARVPSAKSKGYLECLQNGWIEERLHPHGGYAYFVTTEAGAAALRQPKLNAPQVGRRGLAAAPSRLAELPPLLSSLPPDGQG